MYHNTYIERELDLPFVQDLFPPVGFKRNQSLLDIFFNLSGRLKQMEGMHKGCSVSPSENRELPLGWSGAAEGRARAAAGSGHVANIGSWLVLSMEDPTPPLDTLEVVGLKVV